MVLRAAIGLPGKWNFKGLPLADWPVFKRHRIFSIEMSTLYCKDIVKLLTHFVFFAGAWIFMPVLWAHEIDAANGRGMLNIETNDLPQGKAKISANERTHPPGARTPWHTSGPKLIYLMQGNLTAFGLDGKVLATCESAPKLCFFSPHDGIWYFRNTGKVTMKFLLIAIDSPDRPTIHEEVGKVTNISGRQVTFAVGDFRSSNLANPAREISIDVMDVPSGVSVGDFVVTVRHDEKNHRAQSLVKLKTAWE
jgi:hypothetical protein